MAQLVTGRMPFLSSNSLSSSFLYLPHCSLHTSSPISQRMQKQYTYKIVQKINFRFTNIKPISLEWVSDYNMHHDTDIWPCCKVSHYAHTHTYTHTYISNSHHLCPTNVKPLSHSRQQSRHSVKCEEMRRRQMWTCREVGAIKCKERSYSRVIPNQRQSAMTFTENVSTHDDHDMICLRQ